MTQAYFDQATFVYAAPQDGTDTFEKDVNGNLRPIKGEELEQLEGYLAAHHGDHDEEVSAWANHAERRFR